MKHFLKKTMIAGFFTLVPLLIFIFLFEKIWHPVKNIARQILEKFHITHVVLLVIVTVLIILLICFIIGLLARIAMVSKLKDKIENRLLNFLPGYSYIKMLLSEKVGEGAITDKAVLAKENEIWYPGIVIDVANDGRLVVFLPNAPEIRTGRIIVIDQENTQPLSLSVSQFRDAINRYGKGLI